MYIQLASLFTMLCVTAQASTIDQIHMAQGKTPSSMIISWHTDMNDESVVRFGTNYHDLSGSAFGDASTYTYNYYSGNQYVSGYFHHVELSNLEPDTLYFYQVGDFERGSVSQVHKFKTLHKVGDMRPMSLAVVGDLGQTSDSQSTLNHIAVNPKLDMIVHVGDLSYADCNQTMWDSYGNMVQPLAQNRPWMVGPGNHEVEAGVDGTYFTSFETRYRMPAIRPAEFGNVTIPAGKATDGSLFCCPSVFQMEYDFGNSYYSFDSGLVHTIFLNCYATSDSSSLQYQWLEHDLAHVNRQTTPWVIVSMHCPWYSSNTKHYAEAHTTLMRDSMEELFYRYHVNMAFTGHVHAYERTYPVYANETRTTDGVVYVVIGDGGNAEGHASQYYEPTPSWSAFRNGTQYGHGEIHFSNATHLTWEWHRNIDGEFIQQDTLSLCNTALGYSTDCQAL